MQINISSGIGTGPTKLAAFDSALHNAGVSNYNLLCLSSVIPPNSEININSSRAINLPGGWGDRLYVVMAEQRVDIPKQEAWAGIGWVQDRDTGKGLFVEHEGHDEDSVRNDITQSLNALMATRKVNFGPINMKVVGTVCEKSPACALVVAVYQASNWGE